MDLNLMIGRVAAGAAAGAVAYVLVRSLLGLKGRAEMTKVSAGGATLRQILAPIGAFIQRRRGNDVELERKLASYEKLIAQAGGRFLDGATAAEIFAARYILPLIALIVVPLVCTLLRFSPGVALFGGVAFAVLLYFWPEQALGDAAKTRVLRFSRDLPQTLDVMRLVSQSGGDLHGAILTAVDVTPPGPVREELSRVVGEVAIGTSLAAALNNVAERIDSPDANAVFSTMSQALEMGTGVSENLGAAAQLIRRAARTRAQEKAQKAVVAMTFPLLLLILPGVFIVLFAPMIIQFVGR